MYRIAFFFSAILFLAGCSLYTVIPRGKSEISGTYTVNSEIFWSKITEGHLDVWTVDGPALQRLIFVNGLSDGDKIFSVEKQGKAPEYKSDMSFLEIIEFIESSAASTGAVGVTSQNFRPYKFGSLDGFRAEFSFTTKDGLLREGFGVGTKKDEKLYLIFYTGAKLHYFPKHKDDVEYILRSIKIL